MTNSKLDERLKEQMDLRLNTNIRVFVMQFHSLAR